MKNVLLLLLLIGCNQKNLSFRTSDYVSFGMPDPKLTWKIKDYSIALKVLSDVKTNSFKNLPSLTKDENKEIFQRVISTENHEYIFSDLDEQHSLFIKEFAQFIFIYTEEGQEQTQHYHSEIAELMVAYLSINKFIIDKIRTIEVNSLNKDHVEFSIEKLKYAFGSTISSMIAFQNDTISFENKDLEYLSTNISSSIIDYRKFISKEFELQILKLSLMNAEFGSTKIISENYRKVLKEFSN